MNELMQLAGRLKDLRNSLGISIEEMAADCGITTETLIKYESGEHEIPVSFLQRLASRNGVDLSTLLSGEEPTSSTYYVTRKNKGVIVERRSSYCYEDLASGFRRRNMVPFLVTLSPEQTTGSVQANTHDGQEFDYVLQGEVEITVDNKSTLLHSGDCVIFDASLPHAIRAVGDNDAKILAILN